MVLERKTSERLCDGWRSVPSLGVNPCFLLFIFSAFKVQFKLPYDLTIPLPGTYARQIETRDSDRYVILMFITASFTKGWKQPKCPPTGDWINKVGHIHIMEDYSALKRNEIVIHVQYAKS